MARIPTVQENDPATPPDSQEFLNRVETGFGEVFNSLRLLANHPRQGNALIDLSGRCAVNTVSRRPSPSSPIRRLRWPTAALLSPSSRDARSEHRDRRREAGAPG